MHTPILRWAQPMNHQLETPRERDPPWNATTSPSLLPPDPLPPLSHPVPTPLSPLRALRPFSSSSEVSFSGKQVAGVGGIEKKSRTSHENDVSLCARNLWETTFPFSYHIKQLSLSKRGLCTSMSGDGKVYVVVLPEIRGFKPHHGSPKAERSDLQWQRAEAKVRVKTVQIA